MIMADRVYAAGNEVRARGVDLYLNRRLRSQVIHDLDTVNYCT
jgi:hypothetical protein